MTVSRVMSYKCSAVFVGMFNFCRISHKAYTGSGLFICISLLLVFDPGGSCLVCFSTSQSIWSFLPLVCVASRPPSNLSFEVVHGCVVTWLTCWLCSLPTDTPGAVPGPGRDVCRHRLWRVCPPEAHDHGPVRAGRHWDAECFKQVRGRAVRDCPGKHGCVCVCVSEGGAAEIYTWVLPVFCVKLSGKYVTNNRRNMGFHILM